MADTAGADWRDCRRGASPLRGRSDMHRRSSTSTGSALVSRRKIPRLELVALGGAEAKPVAEIGFDVAILGADGFEASREEGRLDRSDGALDLGGQFRGGVGIAPVETVGEKIVFADHLFGHAKRVQEERAGKPGAVLARRAMDHRRRAGLDETRKQLAKTVSVEAYIAAIGFAHDLQRIRRRERARLQPRPKGCDHRRLDRQRMHQDFLHLAVGASELIDPAKIERTLDAESANDLDVGWREVAQMVGAENLSPAKRAAVARRVAAEGAEVAGTLKIEVAVRGF